MKGLRASLYRSDTLPDCSNHGLSSRVHEVTLVGLDGDCAVWEPDADHPAVIVVGKGGRLCLEPLERPAPGNVGWMDGGCLVYSHDSRFPAPYPLQLHDRQETAEQHHLLSL